MDEDVPTSHNAPLQRTLQSFHEVASKQQRRIKRAPAQFVHLRDQFKNQSQSLAGQVSQYQAMYSVLITLAVVLFGALLALAVYCVVLGSRFHDPDTCRNPEFASTLSLQTWLVVRGVTLLLANCFILAAVITRYQSSIESKFSRQSGRVLSSAIGLAELFNFIWLCVGSSWLYKFEQSPDAVKWACPTLVRDFCFYYIVVFWSFILLLIILACSFTFCCGSRRGLDGEESLMEGGQMETGLDLQDLQGTRSLIVEE